LRLRMILKRQGLEIVLRPLHRCVSVCVCVCVFTHVHLRKEIMLDTCLQMLIYPCTCAFTYTHAHTHVHTHKHTHTQVDISPGLRALGRWFETIFPFAILLMMVFIYEHSRGLLVFLWLSAYLSQVPSTLYIYIVYIVYIVYI